MTEIVRHHSGLPAHFQPDVLAAQMDYARALAESSLLPKQYQRQPANLLWAISYGQTLGVDPMTAVQSIHVINGRPTASADLIAGLVRRAGHKLRITGDDRRAEAVIVRADDPEFEFRVVWTIERAQAAKLVGKDTWKQFPAAMLKARAITEVARAACSEILQGTIYTPEELGAQVDVDGNPVDAAVQPLRAVRETHADPDVWAADPVRDWVAEARAAVSVEAVRELYRAAAAAGVPQDVIDAIVAAGRNKPTAEIPEPAPDVPVDAETVPDDPEDLAAARSEVLDAAARLNIDPGLAAQEFASSYGLPMDQATAADLRSFRDVLLDGAA